MMTISKPLFASFTRRITALGFISGLILAHASAAIPAGIQPIHSLLPRQYAPGSSVTLSLQTLPPAGQYQWWHDDSPLPGATQSTLNLTNLSAADSGNYRLRVTNGEVVDHSETITINVLPLPASPIDTSFSAAPPDPLRPFSVGPFTADGSMIVGNFNSADVYTATRLTDSGAVVSDFALAVSAGVVLDGFPDGSQITSKAPFRVSANGSPLTVTLPADFDATKQLTAAVALTGGKFLLAQAKQLARFNADGTVDTAFVYSSVDNPLVSIDSLQVDPSGRIYAGGTVSNPVPTNFPTSWAAVFRLINTGKRDTAFAVQTPFPVLSGSMLVKPLSNGRVLYHSAYHGYRVWRLLLDDGTPDPAWNGSAQFSERPIAVDRKNDVVYITTTQGKLVRYRVTSTSLVEDTTFYAGYSSFDSNYISTDPKGRLLVIGEFDQWEGHPTKRIARLKIDVIAGQQPPNATVLVNTMTPPKNSTVALTSMVTGTGPFTYRWFALDGQPLPPDITSAQLTIPSFSTAHLGRYQLRVTAVGGSAALSNVVELSFSNQQPYLANLSGRAMTGSGENTVIAGLSSKIYAGSRGLSTLLRGVGPALQPLGVANFLPNPALDVFNSGGTVIANNDQWGANPDIVAAARAAGAFDLGGASNDAALLHTFPTGTATLMLRNQGQGDGVGLIEIYQLFPQGHESSYQSLLNLSLRARTGPGDNVAIAGFVIVDPQGFGRTARVLLRAIGPTLLGQGIVLPLQDPLLTLYNNKGEIVAQNDDWSMGSTAAPTIAAAMKQVGAFDLPANSKDSALLMDLPAGPYTIHANGGIGVVLLEIYIIR